MTKKQNQEICECGHRRVCHTSHEVIEGKCNIQGCTCKKFKPKKQYEIVLVFPAPFVQMMPQFK